MTQYIGPKVRPEYMTPRGYRRGITYTMLEYGDAIRSSNFFVANAVKVAHRIRPVHLSEEFVDLVRILREREGERGVEVEPGLYMEALESGGYRFSYSYDPKPNKPAAEKSDAIKRAAVGLLGRLMGRVNMEDRLAQALIESTMEKARQEIEAWVAQRRAREEHEWELLLNSLGRSA